MSSDEDLAVTLTAEDEMSSVITAASEDYRAAMIQMAEESKDASGAVAKVGSSATDAATAVSTAAATMRSSMAGVGEAGHGAGERGGGGLKKVVEFSHEAHRAMMGMRVGAQLTAESMEKVAHAGVNVGTKLLGAAASGNYLGLALMAGATVWGIFQSKAEAAAKAAEKAMDDSIKSAEKFATESTRLAEQAKGDAVSAAKALAEERAKIDDESLSSEDGRYANSVAKARLAEEDKIRALQDRLATENALLENAQAAYKGKKEQSPAERLAAAKEEAVRTAEKAIEATKAAMAAERETAALKRSREERDHALAIEKENLKIRQDSLAVLNRLHEANLKSRLAEQESMRIRVFSLGLDKESMGYASELLKIQELRKQGREAEAKVQEQLLALEKAKALLEKDRDFMKARVEASAKLNQAAEFQARKAREQIGLTQEQLGVSNQIWSLYEGIAAKIKEGLDFTIASEQYETGRLKILGDYKKALDERAESYRKGTAAIIDEYVGLTSHRDITKEIADARARGDSAAAVAASDRLKNLDDQNERIALYEKYQEAVNEAVKSGDSAHVEALKQQYEMEKQILDVKQQETEEQKQQRDLAAAGVSVSGSGLTGAHTDKGLRRKWQERNMKHARNQAQDQIDSHGAMFGGQQNGMGIILEPDQDFNGARAPKDAFGDWPGLGGKAKSGSGGYPELEAPPIPKMPGDLGAPKFLPNETGDGGAVAGLQELNAKLQAFADQQAQFVSAIRELKNTAEPWAGVQQLIADATKQTGDKAKETGTKLNETQKVVSDGLVIAGQVAVKAAEGVKDNATKLADLKKKFDDLVKAIEDAKKMGG